MNESRFNYKTTEILLNGLVSCYDPDIYLSPLAHRYNKNFIFFDFNLYTAFCRFWKLSLQMIARYKKKFSDILFEVNVFIYFQ